MGLRPWHYMHVIESFVAKKREKSGEGPIDHFFTEWKSFVDPKVSQSVTTHE